MNWAKKRFLLILALFTLLTVSACNTDTSKLDEEEGDKTSQEVEKQDEQEVADFEGRSDILKEADRMLNEPQQVITAKELYEKVILEQDPNYLIVDVRDEATFGSGNIEGSINIPYAHTAKEELIELLPKDKTLVVVCFSGHTASQTAGFWNMLGYDALPLLNGMGGWIDNDGLGAPIQAESFKLPVDKKEVAKENFNLPSMLVDGGKDLNDLLIKGSQAYFKEGFSAVKPAPVIYNDFIKKNSDEIMIVDLRTEEDYKKGHLKGSINIPYTELAKEANLEALDSSKEIILIDYNGHVASKAARTLAILGYEAYPIKDGMRVWTEDEKINGIPPISVEVIYDYPTSEINIDLDAETGPAG